MGILDHGALEVAGDHLAGAVDHEGAAHQMDGEVAVPAGEAGDVAGHPLETRLEDVQVVAAPFPLEAFGLGQGDLQGPGEDEIEVVAAAGQVLDPGQLAVADDAHPGGAAADVDEDAVADPQQPVGGRDLVEQADAVEPGPFQHELAGAGLVGAHPRRVGGPGLGELLAEGRLGPLLEGAHRLDGAVEVDDHAVAHGLRGHGVDVDRLPGGVDDREDDGGRAEVDTHPQRSDPFGGGVLVPAGGPLEELRGGRCREQPQACHGAVRVSSTRPLQGRDSWPMRLMLTRWSAVMLSELIEPLHVPVPRTKLGSRAAL